MKIEFPRHKFTLHRNKINALIDFMDQNEIPYRAGKGQWQLYQVYTGDKYGWKVIFDSNNPEHLTYNKELEPIISEFLATQKK